jgi:hypothetical protein
MNTGTETKEAMDMDTNMDMDIVYVNVHDLVS